MDQYAFAISGLDDLADFDELLPRIRLAAQRAVNRATEKGRTNAARRILRQINLPARYLSPGQGRLIVSKRAQGSELEARIRARARPTSLARFVSGTPRKGQGVRVQVAPGKARFLRNAFLIKLRAGSAAIETKSNLGLAVRLRPGDSLRNKSSTRRVASGLYLLYGPSVDQIFRDKSGTGVAEDVSPDILDDMRDEFLRLLEL